MSGVRSNEEQARVNLKLGRRYAAIFLEEIEERLAKERLDVRDAFMLVHAFDHFVDAVRLIAGSSTDENLTGRIDRYVTDIGAHKNGSGLQAMRDVLAHYEEYVKGKGRRGENIPFHPITMNQSSAKMAILVDVGGLNFTEAAGEAREIAELAIGTAGAEDPATA